MHRDINEKQEKTEGKVRLITGSDGKDYSNDHQQSFR